MTAVADTWIELGLSGITKLLSMMITDATDRQLIGEGVDVAELGYALPGQRTP